MAASLGMDVDHVGAALALFIERLELLGAVYVCPVLVGELDVGEDVLACRSD